MATEKCQVPNCPGTNKCIYRIKLEGLEEKIENMFSPVPSIDRLERIVDKRRMGVYKEALGNCTQISEIVYSRFTEPPK